MKPCLRKAIASGKIGKLIWERKNNLEKYNKVTKYKDLPKGSLSLIKMIVLVAMILIITCQMSDNFYYLIDSFVIRYITFR